MPAVMEAIDRMTCWLHDIAGRMRAAGASVVEIERNDE